MIFNPHSFGRGNELVPPLGKLCQALVTLSRRTLLVAVAGSSLLWSTSIAMSSIMSKHPVGWPANCDFNTPTETPVDDSDESGKNHPAG